MRPAQHRNSGSIRALLLGILIGIVLALCL